MIDWDNELYMSKMARTVKKPESTCGAWWTVGGSRTQPRIVNSVGKSCSEWVYRHTRFDFTNTSSPRVIIRVKPVDENKIMRIRKKKRSFFRESFTYPKSTFSICFRIIQFRVDDILAIFVYFRQRVRDYCYLFRRWLSAENNEAGFLVFQEEDAQKWWQLIGRGYESTSNYEDIT